MSTRGDTRSTPPLPYDFSEHAQSSTSLGSSGDYDDASEPSGSVTRPRLTRKRFNEAQVARMEALYARTTHPSRVQREDLASDIDMEAKQVTVWFQNRRQADRKAERTESLESIRDSAGTSTTFVQRGDNSRTRVTLHPLHAHAGPIASTSAVSLDAIAARAEKRAERHDRRPYLSEDDVVAVARPGTLEWACAQERVAHRLGRRPPTFTRQSSGSTNVAAESNSLPLRSGDQNRTEQRMHGVGPRGIVADPPDDEGYEETDIGEETEEEPHEAITPAGSLLADAFKAADARTRAQGGGKAGAELTRKEEEDELMNAALVLAGLGRGR